MLGGSGGVRSLRLGICAICCSSQQASRPAQSSLFRWLRVQRRFRRHTAGRETIHKKQLGFAPWVLCWCSEIRRKVRERTSMIWIISGDAPLDTTEREPQAWQIKNTEVDALTWSADLVNSEYPVSITAPQFTNHVIRRVDLLPGGWNTISKQL